jgi:hypothetical protein
MNKKNVIIFSTLLLTICARAQELKYGIMAGLDLASISMTNASGNGFNSVSNSKTTYHINGILEFKSDSWWGISLEPGFIKKGGGLDFTYSNGYNKISSMNSRVYSNIDLPVLLNVDLNKKFYLSTGLGLDYTLSTTDENHWRAVVLPNYEILPIMDNKFSCSAILGLSYKLNETFNVSIRYNLGLTRLARANLVDGVNNSIYSNCSQLSLKYYIN